MKPRLKAEGEKLLSQLQGAFGKREGRKLFNRARNPELLTKDKANERQKESTK